MERDTGKLRLNKWATAIIIGMAGGLSFELPYLRVVYEQQMKTFLGLSYAQIGMIMSLYGLLALIMYTPSGYIADKFNHRNLISINLAITGALGFVMAAYPPFAVLVVIEVIWAFTTILFMWSATVKSVALLAGDSEEGAIMGLAEGARGIACFVTAIISFLIFNALGGESNPNSFKGVILTYSVLMLVLAVICWFVVPDGKVKDAHGETETVSPRDIITVFKMKETWLCALYVFGVYMSYACLTYSSSYMVDGFGMAMATATAIGIIRSQGFRSVAAPIGGLLTVKTPIHSSTRWLQFGACLNTLVFVVLIVTPIRNSLLGIIITVVLVASFTCYLLRGLYFATIAEVRVPKRIAGTTIGVISLLGFIPDAFIYAVIGHWQDTLPAEMAYRNIWLTGAFGTIMGIVSSTLLLREIKQINEREAALDVAQ